MATVETEDLSVCHLPSTGISGDPSNTSFKLSLHQADMRVDSRRSSLHESTLRLLDRTNTIVTGLTAVTLLYTCSTGIAYFCAGAVACTISVKCIKPILGQARPEKPRQKHTYGMPSTHSATITFYGTYIPSACVWLPLHASLPESPLFRAFVAFVVVLWTCAVAYSRVSLGYHTAPQVIVGCIYGFAFACVWFWLWTHGLGDLAWIVERQVRAYIGS